MDELMESMVREGVNPYEYMRYCGVHVLYAVDIDSLRDALEACGFCDTKPTEELLKKWVSNIRFYDRLNDDVLIESLKYALSK